jgi:hypothetical protein
VLDRLLPTIRGDVTFESDQIRDADFPHVYRMREWSQPEDNASALARFLDIPPERAYEIAVTDYLFVD